MWRTELNAFKCFYDFNDINMPEYKSGPIPAVGFRVLTFSCVALYSTIAALGLGRSQFTEMMLNF